jgi:hypothetical protein
VFGVLQSDVFDVNEVMKLQSVVKAAYSLFLALQVAILVKIVVNVNGFELIAIATVYDIRFFV